MGETIFVILLILISISVVYVDNYKYDSDTIDLNINDKKEKLKPEPLEQTYTQKYYGKPYEIDKFSKDKWFRLSDQKPITEFDTWKDLWFMRERLGYPYSLHLSISPDIEVDKELYNRDIEFYYKADLISYPPKREYRRISNKSLYNTDRENIKVSLDGIKGFNDSQYRNVASDSIYDELKSFTDFKFFNPTTNEMIDFNYSPEMFVKFILDLQKPYNEQDKIEREEKQRLEQEEWERKEKERIGDLKYKTLMVYEDKTREQVIESVSMKKEDKNDIAKKLEIDNEELDAIIADIQKKKYSHSDFFDIREEEKNVK